MKKFFCFLIILSFFTLIYAKPKNIKQIKEKDINILNKLALDCINANDYELADLYLQKSLSIENNYAANIYMAKVKSKTYGPAINYLLNAYELDPTLEVTWYLVAYYSNLERNRDLGFQYYNIIKESDTNIQHLWTVYGELGVYYSIECNFEIADKYLEEAIKLYNDNLELTVPSSGFESYDNSSSLNNYITTNNNRKKLFNDFSCKTDSDLDSLKDSITRELFDYQKRSDSKRLTNLLFGSLSVEEAEPLKIGDKIYIHEYVPFVVVDRQKSANLYYYLFDYCHLTKCYLVISDKQLELEKVLSEGYTVKNNYILEYIGNSTYESNFQDVECYMFRYHDIGDISLYPDGFSELWDLVQHSFFY